MSTLANRTHFRTNQLHGITESLLEDITTPPPGYTQADLEEHSALYADFRAIADKHPKPQPTQTP